jgi:hypothetical protein
MNYYFNSIEFINSRSYPDGSCHFPLRHDETTTSRHTKRCGDVALHREYITAEPLTRAEGRRWCILRGSDGRSSMKTAVVELDAGGRGCHGQSKFVDGWGWVDVGDGAAGGGRRLSRENGT